MEKQNNPKLELKLNESARVKLLKDKCYEGQNGFGAYYLYSVMHDTVEKSFFAPEDIHQQIVSHGLHAGSEFILHKKASQNGKKITGELVFESVKEESPVQKPIGLEPTNGKDLYKEIMAHCLQDAIAIVKSMQDVPFQNEDIRAISSCLFIARTRIN
jgi:hypothetical protein